MQRSKLLVTAMAVLASAGVSTGVLAESNFQTGTGALTASASVDFRIIIPKILYLRVGTGSAYATGALANVTTADLIQFTVPAASIGNGTAIMGGPDVIGGDLSNGVVTAAVVGNNGTITLNATASGALSNGAGDSINFSEITTTASTLTSATALAAPTLTNATSANVTITPATGRVVVRDARWTYSYANTTTPGAGTYGGVNTNNGRVTYTAALP